MRRVQDLVGRGTVASDPAYGMDEVGIPEAMAWKLYGPFVTGLLVRNGYEFAKAQEEVSDKSSTARNVLLAEMQKRPVIVNRAPTLHKFGILALRPKMVPGKTIFVSPIIVKGFNMDHDGDSLINSVFQRFSIVDNEPKSWYKVSKNYNTNGGSEMPLYQRILTNCGLTNLRNLPRLEDTKETKGNTDYYQVPKGVEVQVLTNDMEYKWLPVEKYSVHRQLDMLNVITNVHRSVSVSRDHSLVTLDDDLNLVKAVPQKNMLIPVRNRPIYEHTIDAIELSIPDNTKRKHTFRTYMDLNYHVGHFLGSLVGDGWVTQKSSGYSVCFASVTAELNEYWRTTVEKYITNEPVHFSDVDTSHEFDGHQCTSRKVTWGAAGDFAICVKEWIGAGAENKHFPDFFLEAPISFRRGLLAGLIDTDGTVTNNASGRRKTKPQPNICITTISYQLAYEVVALGQSLGLVAKVGHTTTPNGKPYYTITFNSASILEIQKTLVLHRPNKAAQLSKIRNDINTERTKYGPPLREARINELIKMIGAPRLYKKGTKEYITDDTDKQNEIKRRRSLYTTLRSTVRKCDGRVGHLTLAACKDILSLPIPEFKTDTFWRRWTQLVCDEETSWELITQLEPIPHITEAYDLTIPPAYTMVTESGIVAWDTVTVHLPLSPEAIQDAWRMLPSNNLYSPLDKRPMHTPDMETVMGLNLATTPTGTKVVKKFQTRADAKAAYDRGEIEINDLIEVAELRS
jgi:DNA-directed RNA polymerase beta' subunit